jgi:hypothetical protein
LFAFLTFMLHSLLILFSLISLLQWHLNSKHFEASYCAVFSSLLFPCRSTLFSNTLNLWSSCNVRD